ncbi:hypothetical protein BJP36_01765 [Moorena producens JHB]|uniref:Uncharacterized protein n=1 Tax=Moorena producens (strain JHB) TaxID=1454205 RepID=A0A1D9FUF9_MOOP1|nr:hypothetical protein [Moorena producens]AOY78810.1 hypothetical protein BJP36_01765 [Moorena producens JHB]
MLKINLEWENLIVRDFIELKFWGKALGRWPRYANSVAQALALAFRPRVRVWPRCANDAGT